MKYILHIGLLLLIPILGTAEDRPRTLEGTWISNWHDTKIKIRENRRTIDVKGLRRRGWSTYHRVGRGLYEDRSGNTIRIHCIHRITYRSICGNERIRFARKTRRRDSRQCDRYCSDRDRTNHYESHWSYNDHYDRRRNTRDRDRQNRHDDSRYYGSSSYDRNPPAGYTQNSDRYFVREIDEYIDIRRTNGEIQAKRKNGEWVTYSQNELRKNQYIDRKGNTYVEGYGGALTWKSKNGEVSLNLSKQ